MIAAHAVGLLCEMYRRRVWTDARTVNAIAEGCLSRSSKVCLRCLRFFLGIEQTIEADDEEEDTAAIRLVSTAHVLKGNMRTHSRKTKKKMRLLEKERNRIKRKAEIAMSEEGREGRSNPRFPAIEMLHDAQGFATKLFRRLRESKSSAVFEVRLTMLNFLTRLIGYHKVGCMVASERGALFFVVQKSNLSLFLSCALSNK